VEDVDGLEVDEREIWRAGPTYTIDTLATFPEDEELFLIVGGDAAAGLRTWKRWEEILDRATLVVIPRPGSPKSNIPGLVMVDMGTLEVSGTEIRSRVSEARPFRYLVTPRVYEYVLSHNLYAKDHRDDMVG